MENIIEMSNITKKFPGIIANDNITFKVRKGEVHALLGENGAGKSTLMNVLFGLYKPEEGSIKINGKESQIKNPNDANKYGIGMVHQHFKLVHNFTVLENIILGAESTKNGILQMDIAREKVIELCNRYSLHVDIDAYIEDITVGMQQRVEILKMLYRENEILIFDEPTAVLTPQEIDELMKTMRNLASEGKSIIFITHKLKEIKAVADRCTILRKGKFVKVVDVASTTTEEMSELMVGRKVNLKVDKPEVTKGDVVLNVKNLVIKDKYSAKNKINNISFQVNRGEIVCIAGIDGNGQSELIGAITGLEDITSGEIYLCDENITNCNIRYRNTNGISHIPEDRHKHGLVLDYNVAENIVLQEYFTPRFRSKGFLNFDNINSYAEELVYKYDIRSGEGVQSNVRGMSGGNQQKIILAREIEREHELLIAAQPTRGLDVGAIEQVHKQLVKERELGKAILLVSLELDEVMSISDRILVIYEGELVGELDPNKVTTQELGLYMSGSKRGEIS